MQANNQRGVALITALLIVALATIISVSISTQLQLDVRRTGNILASEQAILYTLTAEDWVRRILRDDRADNNIDHYGEGWATQIPAIPVEGGSIEGRLYDLQACFNLNSLYSTNAANPAATQLAEARFGRLLANLQRNPDLRLNINPNVITQSIIDWMDGDMTQPSADGAEDIYYMNLDRPYRAANAPLQSISELRVIRGFEDSSTLDALKKPDREDEELEHLVCAFGIAADINVNTAPAEVLESLASPTATASINTDSIIKERDDTPFNDIDDFINRNNLQTVILAPDRIGLSMSTSYFLLKTEATIGQARTLMYSILYREANGNTTVISRSQGAY